MIKEFLEKKFPKMTMTDRKHMVDPLLETNNEHLFNYAVEANVITPDEIPSEG